MAAEFVRYITDDCSRVVWEVEHGCYTWLDDLAYEACQYLYPEYFDIVDLENMKELIAGKFREVRL